MSPHFIDLFCPFIFVAHIAHSSAQSPTLCQPTPRLTLLTRCLLYPTSTYLLYATSTYLVCCNTGGAHRSKHLIAPHLHRATQVPKAAPPLLQPAGLHAGELSRTGAGFWGVTAVGGLLLLVPGRCMQDERSEKCHFCASGWHFLKCYQDQASFLLVMGSKEQRRSSKSMSVG